MATAHVLELPELLEMILLQLPTRDLLFAQAVCKPWRHAITSSIRTRRALFLEPGAASDVHRDVATPTLQQFTSTIAFGNDKDRIIPVGDVAVNPLLFELKIFEEMHSYRPEDESKDLVFTGYWITEAALKALKAFNSSHPASCLTMYLTQPPVALCPWITYSVALSHHRSNFASRMGFSQCPTPRFPARTFAKAVEWMAWDIVEEAGESGPMSFDLEWTDVSIIAVGFSRLVGSRPGSRRRRG
ncbi:hypothetical protein B0A54_01385 [Friedmanniomyces endolithicus]|uniref:F-box domain-containing protein n=1 Tax=Friedmanniomyces endolithicus TaxID=329885 RepID=A0A4U0VHY4_9PEZI|nr:hypothetical protein LTS09_016846 [Friedmanniomyces endolithicus]TKA47896.1 hypothetical protein B0A54_01385 [Friedmanniomyces endolithicus]